MQESQTKTSNKIHKNKKTGLRAHSPIYVWVTTEEKRRIRELAIQAHLPVSSYMRQLALEDRPCPKTDKDLLLIFRKICADIGTLCQEQPNRTSNETTVPLPPPWLEKKLYELETFTDRLKENLNNTHLCPQR